MKILFFITGLAVGGAEKVVTSLADSFADEGHQVRIAYLTGEALVLPRNSDIEIIALRGGTIKRVAFAYFHLRRVIKQFKPDVVHSHMYHANIFARLIRLSTPIKKLICTAHSNYEGGRLRMFLYRLTDSLADLSTNVSLDSVNEFRKKKAFKDGRMIPVHNGILTNDFKFSQAARLEVREELNCDDNWKLILAVGSLRPAKDYPTLIRALDILKVNHKNFKLIIAGNGPLRGELNAMIEYMHLSGYIEFLGIRKDIASLMSAADVFVLSSAWEGFGLVLAEAMACERVVVSTDCGGTREVVGDAGFLVPPRDPRALADALKIAIELSPEQKAHLGRCARQRVEEHYSLEIIAEKWKELYGFN